VRVVGAKTFVLRGGVWTDTTYDAGKLRVEQVPFGSARYYELVRANPAWGRYLALGEQVILVDGGAAYQITPSDKAIVAPTAAPTKPTTPPPAATPVPSTPTPQPDGGMSLWERLHRWLSGL
jgi:hypothetical protein